MKAMSTKVIKKIHNIFPAITANYAISNRDRNPPPTAPPSLAKYTYSDAGQMVDNDNRKT